MEFVKEKISEKLEALGKVRLYIDGKAVAEASIRTQSGHYALTGEGLCIGYDSGDAVSRQYGNKFAFKNGTINKVVFDVGNDAYVNLERDMKVRMRD